MDTRLDSVVQNQRRLKFVLYVIIAFLALVAYCIIMLSIQFDQYTKVNLMTDLSTAERLLTPTPTTTLKTPSLTPRIPSSLPR